jgi:hypothetical protein
LSINFYTANGYQQYPQVQKDVNDVKAQVGTVDNVDTKVEKSFLGALPPFRRIMSLPDKFDNGDTLAGVGLSAIMIANLPEDCRDIRAGFNQLKDHLAGREYKPKYDFKKYQHDFSFFKGTLFEDLHKNTKNEKVQKTMQYLYEKDESIFNTKFGEKVQKFLGIESGEMTSAPGMKNRFGQEMMVTEVKASNAFAELTGRAMKRTTKLGVLALGLLEIPKLIKAFGKGDSVSENAGNGAKQVVKSGINLATVTAGIAYGGAFGAKKFGAIGSLVGMGIGAVVGAAGSNKLQDLIG